MRRSIAASSAVLLLSCFVLAGCSGLGSGGRNKSSDAHPEPHTPPGHDSGVAYVRDGRHWYQFRVKLKMSQNPSLGGSVQLVQLDAVSNLWRYNRRSKEYDIQVPGGSLARTGLRFSFDHPGTNDPTILPTTGTNNSGSQSGLDGKTITVAIGYVKAQDPQLPGERFFLATATAALADLSEPEQPGETANASVRRTWKISISPQRQISLEEVGE